MANILTTVEKRLSEVSSILSLIQAVEHDNYACEIDCLMQLAQELTDDTRETVTLSLLSLQRIS